MTTMIPRSTDTSGQVSSSPSYTTTNEAGESGSSAIFPRPAPRPPSIRTSIPHQPAMETGIVDLEQQQQHHFGNGILMDHFLATTPTASNRTTESLADTHPDHEGDSMNSNNYMMSHPYDKTHHDNNMHDTSITDSDTAVVVAGADTTTTTTTTTATTTDDNNNNNNNNVSSCLMQQLMQHVNDQLQQSMADYKATIKCVFKELMAVQEEHDAVQGLWTPIQQAQLVEAARLDALQADVDRTVAAVVPWRAAAAAPPLQPQPQPHVAQQHAALTNGTSAAAVGSVRENHLHHHNHHQIS